ncbi:MAG: hypothetical protein COB93_04655 [Sneathiella sp.]|nr:MAG: hypothetical protein COB93_04655 [Sneathiella sp.]
MFWNRISHQKILSLGTMARTLSLDFSELEKSTASERLREVWHGAVVVDTPSAILVNHASLSEFEFIFEAAPDPRSVIQYLRVKGKDELDGFQIFAKHNKIIAEWRPPRPGHRINGNQKKLLKVLQTEFSIRHMPVIEKPPKSGTGQLMAASVTASIIMAFADGELSIQEKERLVDILSRFKSGYSTPQEILSMVETHVKMLHDEGRDTWPAIMNSLTKEFSVAAKKTVLHAAGTMALADGTFSEEEQTKIAEMAQWIGLDLKYLKEWMREFDVTVTHAEIMGMTVE